jgi:hypothetical protein
LDYIQERVCSSLKIRDEQFQKLLLTGEAKQVLQGRRRSLPVLFVPINTLILGAQSQQEPP